MRLPFCIFKLQGDGSLHFVEALATFDEAKTRVREIGELWPGEYGIENVETGERSLPKVEIMTAMNVDIGARIRRKRWKDGFRALARHLSQVRLPAPAHSLPPYLYPHPRQSDGVRTRGGSNGAYYA